LALALSGCSGSVKTANQTATPTTTATVDTETPSPTTSPPSAIPSATPSASAQVRTPAIAGDVDGDGKPDAVKATADLLTVTLSKTGRRVTAPVHADSPAAPEVLGSTDVDRDGFAEVFLKTIQGASTGFATPYRFDGTSLRELQLDGQPALLGFGGSATHGDGFRCTDTGRLEVRKAEADQSGMTYTVTVNVYRLSSTSLVRLSSATSQAKQDSPEVRASYTIDCGSVGEGQ